MHQRVHFLLYMFKSLDFAVVFLAELRYGMVHRIHLLLYLQLLFYKMQLSLIGLFVRSIRGAFYVLEF